MSFYLLMFRGGVHETIKDKLTKIVESFGSSRFDFPTNPEDYEREIKEVEEQYDEIMETVNLTKNSHRKCNKFIKRTTV